MTGAFDFVQSFAFCMIRPAVALSLLPFGNQGALSKALRTPLVLMFAALPEHDAWPANPVRAIVVEAGIGLVIGLALGVVFHVASTAGALLDQQAGYTIGAVYDPNFSDEASVFQTLFTQFAALTFFTGDGLKVVFGVFADSWTAWPPGHARIELDHLFAVFSEERFASSFAEGLRLATPLVALLVLVDLSFGLMSRHAKRLNPFATARIVKVMIVSLAVSTVAPTILAQLLRMLSRQVISG